MKGWLKRMSVSFISLTLPFFAIEIFVFFVLFNIANRIEDIPAFLPLNVDFYK